jgi:hypothetical protein
MTGAMGRKVARLYAQRREAMERYVPFWLPGGSPVRTATPLVRTVRMSGTSKTLQNAIRNTNRFRGT